MNVLVVGGDEAQKQNIGAALPQSAGTRLAWATGIDDALAKLKSDPLPSVILVEQELVAESSAAMSRLAGEYALPIIVFCHVESDEDVSKLVAMGAADVVGTDELTAAAMRRLLAKTAARVDSPAQFSNQINSLALEFINDGVIVTDMLEKVKTWSAGMERMFGISAAEAVGKSLTELVPFARNDQKSVAEAKQGKQAQGGIHQYYVQRRGSYMRFQFTYSPLRSATGVTGLVCFVRESHSASEMQVITSMLQQRLKLLADAMPNMMWICDQNGDRLLFNNKWLEFTGRDLAAERDRGWMENVDQQDLQKVWKICSKALLEKQSYHVQYRLKRADGQSRLVLESATPQFSANGTFIGMMGSCSDVSMTRLTQQGISSPNTLGGSFSSTLDHAPIAIWRLDHDLVVRKVNPAVLTMLGLESSEIIGKHISSVAHSLPEKTFMGVLENGDRIQLEGYTLTLHHSKTPRQVVWDIVAWPLKDNDGNVIGVCMSSAEVSEKELISQQRDNFVAALVHDLKTPLVGADRTLEQMVNGALGSLDPGQTDVLNMLRRSNHQLLLMIQNLIEVYRYEAGEPTMTVEELDLSELINVAMAELKALAEHKGVHLTANLSEPIYMNGDRLALRRVFLNLLDNALKFTSRGDKVWVTFRREKDKIKLTVGDTGIGISLHDQKKLFRQFFQGEAGKRYAPGTGLGLYLCKQIINNHGGTIDVESFEGQGTTFTITIPISAGRAPNQVADEFQDEVVH